MQSIKKILYPYKSAVVGWLLRVSAKLGWVWLAAMVLRREAVLMDQNSGPTVLCMGRTIFIDDVKALARFGGSLHYVTIFRPLFKEIFFAIVGERAKSELTEDNYHSSATYRKKFLSYRRFMKAVLSRFQRTLKIQAVLSGNFGYLEQQEIFEACRELGIPYLVLFKEGMTVPESARDHANYYRARKFLGSKFLCYNGWILEALLEAKISGLEPNNVSVVGVPRFDTYFRQLPPHHLPLKIVFFSFYLKDKFKYLISDPIRLRKAGGISDEFHSWIIKFASHHPDVQVIVKTKAAPQYLNYVREVLIRSGGQPPNLTVTSSVDASKLVLDSSAVLGYNSTVLLEALAVERSILSPYFGDLLPGKMWDFFSNFPGLIKYVRSYAEMDQALLNPGKMTSENLRRRDEILRKFISFTDGKSSQRVEKALLQAITK